MGGGREREWHEFLTSRWFAHTVNYNDILSVLGGFLTGNINVRHVYGPENAINKLLRETNYIKSVSEYVRHYLRRVCRNAAEPASALDASTLDGSRNFNARAFCGTRDWIDHILGGYGWEVTFSRSAKYIDSWGRTHLLTVAHYTITNVMGRESLTRIFKLAGVHFLYYQNKETPGPTRSHTMIFKWAEDVWVECCQTGGPFIDAAPGR